MTFSKKNAINVPTISPPKSQKTNIFKHISFSSLAIEGFFSTRYIEFTYTAAGNIPTQMTKGNNANKPRACDSAR